MREGFFWSEVFDFDKNFQFLSKTTTSLQKNPSRTPFERSEKQCVVNHEYRTKYKGVINQRLITPLYFIFILLTQLQYFRCPFPCFSAQIPIF